MANKNVGTCNDQLTTRRLQKHVLTLVLQSSLEFVKVVTQRRNFHLDVLAFPHSQSQLLHFTCFHAITWHVIPVVKHALREGLPTCLLSESCHKSEGLRDGKVCPRLHERRSLSLVLLKHAPTSHVHTRVHPTHRLLRAHNLNQEHWFLQRWFSHHFRRKARTTCGWHDLA